MDLLRSLVPVLGHVPSLSRTERISGPVSVCMVAQIDNERTAVILRFGIHSCASAVEHPVHFVLLVQIDNQWCPQEMVAGSEFSVCVSGIHVCHSLPHILAWNHRHVLDAEALEDILLQVLVQFQAGCSFQSNSRPVNTNLLH